MKSAIVCVSEHHGNTLRIAEVMAEQLAAVLLTPAEVDPAALGEYDLVGFGSGIYRWRHHADLLALVKRIPQGTLPAAFIFSTRGASGYVRQHSALREALTERQIRIVDEFSCRGYDTMGPLSLIGGINRNRPNQEDVAAAREFATALQRGVLQS